MLRARAAVVTFATAALLAGCEGITPDPSIPPPTVGNPGATAREPLRAARRPGVVRTFPLDYSSIPELLVTQMSAADSAAEIALVKTPSGAEQARVSGDLIVEIVFEKGGIRAFTSDPVPPPAPKDKDGKAPASPECVSRLGTAPVSWEGFSLETWSDNAIDYVLYQGTYDFETCRAKPSHVARVRAPAVLPGVAYAFRTRTSVRVAGQANAGDTETLVIIAPPARWVGSTALKPEDHTQPHVGLFTRMFVPLKRGGASSMFMHVSDTDIAAFGARRRYKPATPPDVPAGPLIQIGFDFSWPESDPVPTGLGFVGPVSNDQPTSVYTFDDDAILESATLER